MKFQKYRPYINEISAREQNFDEKSGMGVACKWAKGRSQKISEKWLQKNRQPAINRRFFEKIVYFFKAIFYFLIIYF